MMKNQFIYQAEGVLYCHTHLTHPSENEQYTDMPDSFITSTWPVCTEYLAEFQTHTSPASSDNVPDKPPQCLHFEWIVVHVGSIRQKNIWKQKPKQLPYGELTRGKLSDDGQKKRFKGMFQGSSSNIPEDFQHWHLLLETTSIGSSCLVYLHIKWCSFIWGD